MLNDVSELPLLLTADEAAALLRTTRKAIYVMAGRRQLPDVTNVAVRLRVPEFNGSSSRGLGLASCPVHPSSAAALSTAARPPPTMLPGQALCIVRGGAVAGHPSGLNLTAARLRHAISTAPAHRHRAVILAPVNFARMADAR